MTTLITKTLAAASISAALCGVAAVPALAAPAVSPAPIADSGSLGSGSSTESARGIAAWPVGLLFTVLCGADETKGPLCQVLYAIGTGITGSGGSTGD